MLTQMETQGMTGTKKNLVNRYMDDLPNEHTAMYYIKSFIRHFRGMSEQTVEGTIWYDLWLEHYQFDDDQLESKILNLATLLNSRNSIFFKVTSVQDAVTASESSV